MLYNRGSVLSESYSVLPQHKENHVLQLTSRMLAMPTPKSTLSKSGTKFPSIAPNGKEIPSC
jgi:hypothetical protein